MNIEQALEVFNPQNQRLRLAEQREAYQVLKQGIKDMQRDLDLAIGNYTISIASTDAGDEGDIWVCIKCIDKFEEETGTYWADGCPIQK